jgi:hypothetical protein
MQNFDFHDYLPAYNGTGLFVFMLLTFIIMFSLIILFMIWIMSVTERLNRDNYMYAVFRYVAVITALTVSFNVALLSTDLLQNALGKEYHNDNTVVFPETTLIARNNSDEYTVQSRHAKPVTFKFQDGNTKHVSLVDVSAKQVSSNGEASTSTYFKRNSIVKLPLDKSDDIQTGDRVTTAKKTLHVNYTGKKAFKLHVTKIERPVSADKTQWRTVYEAK